MSTRFRTKPGGVLKKRHIFLLVLIIMTLVSIQGFIFVERNLEPALKEIARTYVKQIATFTITDAISKKINEDIQEVKILVTEKDKDGKIALISFDHSRMAKIITQITERANEELLELSKEPISIPIGQALNSNILAQLGPKVPITLMPMGAAKADISMEMNEAGINVVAVEIYLTIEVDVRIVIPFSSDESVVTTKFPIDGVVIPGDVPHVYFKGENGQLTPIPISINPEEKKNP